MVGQCEACGAEERFLRLILRSGVEPEVETKEASFSPYLILWQSDRSQSFSFCIPFFDPEIVESSSDMALHFHGQHAQQFHLVPHPL